MNVVNKDLRILLVFDLFMYDKLYSFVILLSLLFFWLENRVGQSIIFKQEQQLRRVWGVNKKHR